MSQKDLFIVESPFQLLGAIEALAHFKPEKAVLIVKYSREQKNNSQITKLISLAKWNKVIKFKTVFFVSLSEFAIVAYIAFLKFFGYKYKKIFIGEPRSRVMLAFLSNINHESSFFLDDGNFSLYMQKGIQEGKKLNTFIVDNSAFRKGRLLYYRIFNIKEDHDFLPNWFTCFDLYPIDGQIVVENKFHYLRLRQKEVIKTEQAEVYFIGGNLSECGVVSEVNELNAILKMSLFYMNKGINVIYCAHRRESAQKLKRIECIDGVSIRFATYPLEIDLIINGNDVRYLSSFYSTALITISQIFKPIDIKMFVIPEDSINEVYQNEVRETYRRYRSIFEEVNINDI